MSGLNDFIRSDAAARPLTREMLDEGMRQIRDLRWICKACAWTTGFDPVRGVPGGFAVRACPECGAHEWKQTSAPVPAV